jgi:long-chain acyl-CoA synthetase
MKFNNNNTLIDFFYHWEKNTPDNVFLKQPFGDDFRDFTWRETGIQVRKIANYLKNLNIPKGSNIALISKNCAEWIITDLAIIMSGHVSVPLYPTLVGHQINQVLSHSDSKYAFIGKLDDWHLMKPGIPSDVTCIAFPTYNPDPEHLQWDDILSQNEPLAGEFRPNLSDINTIIYTSGTTGNPKGVVSTHGCFSECIINTKDYTYLEKTGTRFFSYLPLCHIAERNIVEAVSIVTGGTVFFSETLETFAKNLRDANPTHFLAVPRIWTKFQLGILAKMPQKKLNLFLKIPFLGEFVKNKIKKGLGLSSAWIYLTGAAPMPTYLIQWYRKLGINIQEAYGMTENLGAVCMMPAAKVKDGTVGKIYPGMEVKIAEETGEILTKSKWNMTHYYKEPQLTAETIDPEGYIHTGDVGEVDSEGYLKITGRVKEMYKTSKGEYVAPAQIEMSFADNPNIEQICLVGQSLPQPIALIVVSDFGKMLSREDLVSNFEENLKLINPTLKSYEKIQKIIILKEPWNVENNKLTPTFKIKRNIIEKEFAPFLENWYEQKPTIIFE